MLREREKNGAKKAGKSFFLAEIARISACFSFGSKIFSLFFFRRISFLWFLLLPLFYMLSNITHLFYYVHRYVGRHSHPHLMAKSIHKKTFLLNFSVFDAPRRLTLLSEKGLLSHIFVMPLGSSHFERFFHGVVMLSNSWNLWNSTDKLNRGNQRFAPCVHGGIKNQLTKPISVHFHKTLPQVCSPSAWASSAIQEHSVKNCLMFEYFIGDRENSSLGVDKNARKIIKKSRKGRKTRPRRGEI